MRRDDPRAEHAGGRLVTEADDDESFEREVLRSALPVVVDFWAPWCGPCRMVAPELDKLADDYRGRLRVVKVNVDRNQAVASRFKVMSIPLIGLFRDGELVASSVGAKPGAAIAADLRLDRLPPPADHDKTAPPSPPRDSERGVREVREVREVVTKRPKLRPDGTY